MILLLQTVNRSGLHLPQRGTKSSNNELEPYELLVLLLAKTIEAVF